MLHLVTLLEECIFQNYCVLRICIFIMKNCVCNYNENFTKKKCNYVK